MMLSDIIDICIDEISLSGLEGAPLDLLWLRLINRNILKNIDDDFKNFIWRHLKHRANIMNNIYPLKFYKNPVILLPNKVFDNFYWLDMNNTSLLIRKYVPDNSIWFMVKEEKNDNWGCARYYRNREDITEIIIYNDMDLIQAVKKWGKKLIIVAHQNLRELSLTTSGVDTHWMKWTFNDYSVLEAIGKAREFGILRNLLNTSYSIGKAGTKPFHIIQALKKLKLIIIEDVTFLENGQMTNGSIVKLSRYIGVNNPCNIISARGCSDLVHFLDSLSSKTASRKYLSSKFGTSEVRKLILAGYLRKSIKINSSNTYYELIRPIETKEEYSEAVNYSSSNDDQDLDEALVEDVKLFAKRFSVLYHRNSSLLLQAYKSIFRAEKEGLYYQDFIRALPINQLIARRIPITLENSRLSRSVLEEFTDKSNKFIRKYRITAVYSEISISNLQPDQNLSTKECPVIPDQLKDRSSYLDYTNSFLDIESLNSLNLIKNDSLLFESFSTVKPIDEVTNYDINVITVTFFDNLDSVLKEVSLILINLFPSSGLNIQLKIFHPMIPYRKLETTNLYERRKADILSYIKLHKYVSDRSVLLNYLIKCDKKVGMASKVDRKTISRLLVDLQLSYKLYQYKLIISRGENIRETIVIAHYSLAPTGEEFLSKCQQTIALKIDQIARKAMRTQCIPYLEVHKSSYVQALPRFQKLRAIHLYLFILAYGSNVQLDYIDLPFSWTKHISKLPLIDGVGEGWINVGTALSYIPFSLFYSLNTVRSDYYDRLTNTVRLILQNPNKRDLEMHSIDLYSLGNTISRIEKNYTQKWIESLTFLIKLGIVEIEDSEYHSGLKNEYFPHFLLSSSIKIKKSLTLIDTCREAHGYRRSFFKNESRAYFPSYTIFLNSAADIEYYWMISEIIALNSKIIIQEKTNSKYNSELYSLLAPKRNSFTKGNKNRCLSIDHLGFGACGYFPSSWSHKLTNWQSLAIDSKICHFDLGCRNLAFMSKSQFDLQNMLQKNVPNDCTVIPSAKTIFNSFSKSKFILDREFSRDKRLDCNYTNVHQSVISFVESNKYLTEKQNSSLIPKRNPPWADGEIEILILCYITSLTFINLWGPSSTIHNISEMLANITNRYRSHKSIIRCIQRKIYREKIRIGNFCEQAQFELTKEMKENDLDECTFDFIYQNAKKKFSDCLLKKISTNINFNYLITLPTSTAELEKSFTVKKFHFSEIEKPMKELFLDDALPLVHIQMLILHGMVISTLSMENYRYYETYVAYLMFNKSPKEKLTNVIDILKKNHILAKNKESIKGANIKFKIKNKLISKLSDHFPSSKLSSPELIPYGLLNLNDYFSIHEDFHEARMVDIVYFSDTLSFSNHLNYNEPLNFNYDILFPLDLRFDSVNISHLLLIKIIKSYDKIFEVKDVEMVLPIAEYQSKIESTYKTSSEDFCDVFQKYHVPRNGIEEFELHEFSNLLKVFKIEINFLKVSEVIVYAYKPDWIRIDFETREVHISILKPNINSMIFSPTIKASLRSCELDIYLFISMQYLSLTSHDCKLSMLLFKDIFDFEKLGICEQQLLQKYQYSYEMKELKFNAEQHIQNLLNFQLAIRAGLLESTIILNCFSQPWQHPITGFDSPNLNEINKKLSKNYISSFKPWYGLTHSCLNWNISLLNNLFTTLISFISNHPGVCERKIFQYISGYIQLKQLREILQCLTDSGYIHRFVLNNRLMTNKATLFSRKYIIFSTINRDDYAFKGDSANIFYEVSLGKDLLKKELLLKNHIL